MNTEVTWPVNLMIAKGKVEGSLVPRFKWVVRIWVFWIRQKISHFSGVHRVTRTTHRYKIMCTERGDRDDPVWVRSFDQEICVYVRVTLCTPEKWRIFHLFPLSLIPRYHPLSQQCRYLSSLFLNCIQKIWCLPVLAGMSDPKKPDPYY